jgi:hypothetical protein
MTADLCNPRRPDPRASVLTPVARSVQHARAEKNRRQCSSARTWQVQRVTGTIPHRALPARSRSAPRYRGGTTSGFDLVTKHAHQLVDSLNLDRRRFAAVADPASPELGDVFVKIGRRSHVVRVTVNELIFPSLSNGYAARPHCAGRKFPHALRHNPLARQLGFSRPNFGPKSEG